MSTLVSLVDRLEEDRLALLAGVEPKLTLGDFYSSKLVMPQLPVFAAGLQDVLRAFVQQDAILNTWRESMSRAARELQLAAVGNVLSVLNAQIADALRSFATWQAPADSLSWVMPTLIRLPRPGTLGGDLYCLLAPDAPADKHAAALEHLVTHYLTPRQVYGPLSQGEDDDIWRGMVKRLVEIALPDLPDDLAYLRFCGELDLRGAVLLREVNQMTPAVQGATGAGTLPLPPIEDPTDKRIFEWVTADPDLTDQEIGQRLQISRQAANTRRRRLELMGYRVR